MTQDTPSQYAIFNGETIIEHTGYLPNVAAARKYVKNRYRNTSGLFLQKSYPVRESALYPVN